MENDGASVSGEVQKDEIVKARVAKDVDDVLKSKEVKDEGEAEAVIKSDSEHVEAASSEKEAVQVKKPINMSAGAVKLRNWLNKCLRVEMSDGRVLVGIFLCTDRDANIILGSCTEYLPEENKETSSAYVNDEPRMLGLVMVPGKHIVSISIDENEYPTTHSPLSEPLTKEVSAEDVM